MLALNYSHYVYDSRACINFGVRVASWLEKEVIEIGVCEGVLARSIWNIPQTRALSPYLL
jgi:hypothetical protein